MKTGKTLEHCQQISLHSPSPHLGGMSFSYKLVLLGILKLALIDSEVSYLIIAISGGRNTLAYFEIYTFYIYQKWLQVSGCSQCFKMPSESATLFFSFFSFTLTRHLRLDVPAVDSVTLLYRLRK